PVTPATVPSAPAKPTAAAGDGKLTVSWSAPASNGSAITSYAVTVYAYPLGTPPAIAGTATVDCTSGNACAASPVSAPVSGLTNGAQYVASVAAANAVGTGAASPDSDPAVPSQNPSLPSAPLAVSATAG